MRRRAAQHADDCDPRSEPIGPFLIGPHLDSGNFERQPVSHEPAADLLEDARLKVRCDNEEELQARALWRRLVVAFVLIVLIGSVFFVVMPHYGMNLHPFMPIFVFVAIAAGALLSGPRVPKKPRCAHQDGRPIGCCQGPRPLRSFRDDA